MEERRKTALKREMGSETTRLKREYETTAFYEPVGFAVIKREAGIDERLFVERAGTDAVINHERNRAGGDPEKSNRIKDV